MSLPKFLGALGVLFVVSAFGAREANPREAGADTEALRGPGAALRSQVQRSVAAVAEGDVARVDALLDTLRVRVTDPLDPLPSGTLAEVARELCLLRAAAVAPGEDVVRGSRRDFLLQVAGEASWSDWRWGVPASITLAQAVLESNWGRSAPGHNLFGMKGEGPAGSIERRVVEYRRGRRSKPSAPFRLYFEPAESIRDHGSLLGNHRRYARARSAGEDRAAFAAGLVGIYATDPRYQGKLLRIVDLYELDRFDVRTSAPWGAPAPDAIGDDGPLRKVETPLAAR